MTRIGQYEVGELLGEGGIGRVHAAYDLKLGREVAIKSLRPAHLNDAGFVERFRAEATNLARLNHPNIATVHSLVEQGRSTFIVMERVRGQTLEQILKGNKNGLDVGKSLAIIAQAADGLAYAHAMGVIHRDIKPANIMIVPSSGLVKIMDFGIARLRGSQRVTRDGGIVGTLAYMAPEQLRGEPADERSDLYSLAIVLYEMLNGSPPFVGATDYELMQALIHAKPPRLRNRRPDVDPGIEAVLNRALAKWPEQRFASVLEFRQALGACAGHHEAPRALHDRRTVATKAGDTVSGRVKFLDGYASKLLTMVAATMTGTAQRIGLALFAGAVVLAAGLAFWGEQTFFADDPVQSSALAKLATVPVLPPPPDIGKVSYRPTVIMREPRLDSGRHDEDN